MGKRSQVITLEAAERCCEKAGSDFRGAARRIFQEAIDLWKEGRAALEARAPLPLPKEIQFPGFPKITLPFFFDPNALGSTFTPDPTWEDATLALGEALAGATKVSKQSMERCLKENALSQGTAARRRTGTFRSRRATL